MKNANMYMIIGKMKKEKFINIDIVMNHMMEEMKSSGMPIIVTIV